MLRQRGEGVRPAFDVVALGGDLPPPPLSLQPRGQEANILFLESSSDAVARGQGVHKTVVNPIT